MKLSLALQRGNRLRPATGGGGGGGGGCVSHVTMIGALTSPILFGTDPEVGCKLYLALIKVKMYIFNRLYAEL